MRTGFILLTVFLSAVLVSGSSNLQATNPKADSAETSTEGSVGNLPLLAWWFPVYQPGVYGAPDTITIDGTGDARNVGRDMCITMVCKRGSGTTWFLTWWYNLFGLNPSENTLFRGSCGFEVMTTAQLKTFMTGLIGNSWTDKLPSVLGFPAGKEYIRPFMYGQGMTFSEFDAANIYCKGNLSMVMKWIRNPEDTTQARYVAQWTWEKKLQRAKAECYLKANVLPVYIFYTNSTLSAMDTGKMADFLNNFKDPSTGDEIGPLVIDPEFAYDANKPGVVNRVKQLVTTIRTNCRKCLIMLSPREGDMAGLDAVMSDPAMQERVNLTGQGWDLNLDKDCSVYMSFNNKLNFSKAVLARYHLPTLVAYVSANASQSYGGTCTWTTPRIKDAYDLIYTNTPALVSAGIIGLGSYQLLDGHDALMNCTGNCEYGLMTADEQQKPELFPLWFGRCSEYYNSTTKPGNYLAEQTRAPLTFNYYGDNGTDCDVLGQLSPYKMIRPSTTPETFTFPVPRPLNLRGMYNCDRCFWIKDLLLFAYGMFPNVYMYPPPKPHLWFPNRFNDIKLGMDFNNVPDPYTLIPNYCTAYSASFGKAAEISCKWDMDPLFMKAVASQDSALDKCKAYYAPVSDPSCNVGGTSSSTITDPSGDCPTAPSAASMGMKVNPVSGKCEVGGTGGDCKVCSIGLLMCPYKPYDQQTYSGRDPLGCGPNFNPFDTQMGLCCGTSSLCKSMESAVSWAYISGGVDRIRNLSLSTNQDNWAYVDRDKWTILLITLAIYDHNGNTAFIENAYNHWLQTKWCPNSLTTFSNSVPVTVSPEGPKKTFIWTYCNVYNDTGGVFTGQIPDPLEACKSVSVPGTCYIACAGHPSSPGTGYWPTVDGPTLDPVTIDMSMFDTFPNFAKISNCLSAPECVTPYGASYYCPHDFWRTDPNTYRCNTQGNCCGGSFPEHLCCLDPYPCQVLDAYMNSGGSTISHCDPNQRCKKAI